MNSNNNANSWADRESLIKKSQQNRNYDDRRSSSFIQPNPNSSPYKAGIYSINNDDTSLRTPKPQRHSFILNESNEQITRSHSFQENPYLHPKHNNQKDDEYGKFDETQKKKKGSDDDSDEEKDSEDVEQNQYFVNEEKVIRNHLKLNVCSQIVQIVIFLLAVTVLDWTHILAGDENNIQRYHVSLVKVTSDDDVQTIWLYSLTDSCLSQQTGEATVTSELPAQLCERAGSLFLAGAFTIIGLTIVILINLYNTLILMLFIKKLQLTGYQLVFFRYLVHVQLFVVAFYFVVSMSFIYITQMGLGLCASIIGVMLTTLSRRHFLKQYNKIKHMQLVKTLVVEENETTNDGGNAQQPQFQFQK